MKTLSNSIIIIIFIIIITIVSGQAAAVSPTATSSPTPKITSEQKEQDTIEKIKDLVASKVAELKLVDKRAILGIVKRSSTSQLVIEDHKGNQRSVDIDELTKFVSSKETFGISDITRGDQVSVIGLYNKDTKRILARFISLSVNIPINYEGVVVSKNPRQFSFTAADANGKTKTIDVETSTKTSVWAEESLTKSGFSKILAGERVLIIGFDDSKNKDTINGSRIIHFADLPLSSELEKYRNIEETPVSTGSGVKLQQLNR